MKRLIFLLWSSALGGAYAQNIPIRETVAEGVRLYDAGKYDEAVAKYQQALAAAPEDPTANSELALTYNELGRYEDAWRLCQKLLKANPVASPTVYMTGGNSLDALKRPKEALQLYQKGLKYHPESSALYYNRGVTEATSGLVPAAVGSFQQAVLYKPSHASSHMSLGVMELQSQARIPAILALTRFLVLEPRSQRAAQRLPLLDRAIMQGVSRTDKNTINISIGKESLDAANRKRPGPDNFGQVEFTQTLMAGLALGKDSSQTQTETERFAKQFTSLCESLEQGMATTRPPGFTWEYYVPYFVELKKKGYVSALSYLIHASQTKEPAVQQWLAAHPSEVAVFEEWSKNYTWPKPKS